MKKRTLLITITSVSVVIFTLAGLSIVGIRYAIDDSLRRSTDDAVEVIAGSVAQLYGRGKSPTAGEVEDTIKSLINASVINAGFDRNQKATDLYHTPFQVTHYFIGMRHFVSVASAGPDRVFGTPDDITHTAESDSLSPEKK